MECVPVGVGVVDVAGSEDEGGSQDGQHAQTAEDDQAYLDLGEPLPEQNPREHRHLRNRVIVCDGQIHAAEPGRD